MYHKMNLICQRTIHKLKWEAGERGNTEYTENETPRTK